jgi:hypothetical protein
MFLFLKAGVKVRKKLVGDEGGERNGGVWYYCLKCDLNDLCD